MSPTSVQNPNPTPIALKIPDAAKALGVKPITIRRLIERGELRPNRSLRTPLIPISQLHAFIEAGIAA